MAMKPSAKKKLGVLGIGLVVLAIDRGLIFSGGSDANAQATGGAAATATPTAPQQKSSAAPAIEVASVLETLRQAVARESPDRDAFRLPEILAVQPEAESSPIPMTEGEAPQAPQAIASSPDMPSFEVTSIIAASTSEPMAVINGTPIRVGQTREGITLVSVSTRTATIRYADRTVEVKLSVAR